MTKENDKLINVYKASAGSGKTYTLTKEYIDLILRSSDAYKHVLAVTFTNKATDEMKQRIIEELYALANGNDGEERKKELAKEVLVNILHDYSAFSVSTIDKFFQGVMRSFARELGRMATYNIELDADSVRKQAVDMLFADLDKEENRELLKWLIDFSLEKIDDGDAWGVKKSIDELSESLFSEDFKLKQDNDITAQEQREQIGLVKQTVTKIITDYEKRCKDIAKRALDMIGKVGFTYASFKGGEKSSAFKIFPKLVNGTAYDDSIANLKLQYNNPEDWPASKFKNKKAIFETLYAEGLNDCIGELIEHFEQNQSLYITAVNVRAHLNSLGILGCVYANILQYCKENNVMLLSETTELLGKIIDGSDTPFVYEKVGVWINNFMLDEFQDTSSMQWNNFLPLLRNSTAMGEKSLIVGDVKQSIYRWRNSDWTILNSNIDKEFGNIVEHNILSTNWRSMKSIVTFNNLFFKAAAKTASLSYVNSKKFGRTVNRSILESNAALISDIYSNFEQDLPKDICRDKKGSISEGYIEVKFVDNELLKPHKLKYEQVMEKLLLETMQRLISNGYKEKDIGILVRKNWQGAEVAKILLEAGYRVVSTDSLTIASSPVVEKIINILREIDLPESNALRAYSFIKNVSLAASLDSNEREAFLGMPLYQMCEEIIRVYLSEQERENVVFIQAFLDVVLDFTIRNGSTLGAFVRWWDETGFKKTISFPEGQDAVQVMTIHKSKGLAFDVVIMPYFNEPLSSEHTSLLWSNSASEQLKYKGPLPVKSVKALNATLFEKDYQTEILNEHMDALNMAYVAFTRPRQELLVIVPKAKKSKEPDSYSHSSVADILYDYSQTLCESEFEDFRKIDSEVEFDENIKIGVEGFSIGCPLNAEENRKLKEQEQKKRAEKGNTVGIYKVGGLLSGRINHSRMKTSLQSGSINESLSLRDNGIVMHDVFATINTIDDVMDIRDEDIKAQVLKLIASVEDRGWFSGKYDVFRECSIIQPSGSILRPDRVLVSGTSAIVIDYKFGEYKPTQKKYHKQVQQYMQLLMDMGFEPVTGYLWYMKDAVIETVSL